MATLGERPAIPEDIKREVRQHCRFGCAICGVPVYHYDHIEDFAAVKEHKAANLVLLCPTHHQEKTSNRLPVATVRKARASPHNAEQPVTSPYRWHFVPGSEVVFELGTSVASYDLPDWKSFAALEIENEPVLWFRNDAGELLLNVTMRGADGGPVLVIEDGEIKISTAAIDVKLEGTRLSIRHPDQPPIEIRKLDNGIKVERGLFRGRTQLRVEVLPNSVTELTYQQGFRNISGKNFPTLAKFSLPENPRPPVGRTASSSINNRHACRRAKARQRSRR